MPPAVYVLLYTGGRAKEPGLLGCVLVMRRSWEAVTAESFFSFWGQIWLTERAFCDAPTHISDVKFCSEILPEIGLSMWSISLLQLVSESALTHLTSCYLDAWKLINLDLKDSKIGVAVSVKLDKCYGAKEKPAGTVLESHLSDGLDMSCLNITLYQIFRCYAVRIMWTVALVIYLAVLASTMADYVINS